MPPISATMSLSGLRPRPPNRHAFHATAQDASGGTAGLHLPCLFDTVSLGGPTPRSGRHLHRHHESERPAAGCPSAKPRLVVATDGPHVGLP